MSRKYRVSWTIRAEAESPLEAAARAYEAQQASDSTATVFHVHRAGRKALRVDVMSIMDENGEWTVPF